MNGSEDSSSRSRADDAWRDDLPTLPWLTPVALGIGSMGMVALYSAGVGGGIDASRLAGAGWLALGVVSILAAARLQGVGTAAALPVAVAVGVTPAILDAATTGVGHSTGLLAGGAALLSAAIRARSGRGEWLLPAVGAGAVALGAANILGVAAAATYLAILRPAGDRRPDPGSIRAAGLLLGGGLVALLGWFLAPAQPLFGAEVAEALDLSGILGEATALVTPIDGVPDAAAFDGPWIGWLNATFAIVLVAAAAGAAVRDRGGPGGMALAGLGTMTGGVLLLALVGRVLQEGSVLTARDGLSLVPIMAVVLATGLHGAVTRWTFTVMAAGWALLTVWRLVGAL